MNRKAWVGVLVVTSFVLFAATLLGAVSLLLTSWVRVVVTFAVGAALLFVATAIHMSIQKTEKKGEL